MTNIIDDFGSLYDDTDIINNGIIYISHKKINKPKIEVK